MALLSRRASALSGSGRKPNPDTPASQKGDTLLKVLKPLLTVVGILAVLLGLIWMGQGSGYFPYPATSFMISQTPWIGRGAMLAVVGLVLVILGRRL
jgi:hypothetical protein